MEAGHAAYASLSAMKGRPCMILAAIFQTSTSVAAAGETLAMASRNRCAVSAQHVAIPTIHAFLTRGAVEIQSATEAVCATPPVLTHADHSAHALQAARTVVPDLNAVQSHRAQRLQDRPPPLVPHRHLVLPVLPVLPNLLVLLVLIVLLVLLASRQAVTVQRCLMLEMLS